MDGQHGLAVGLDVGSISINVVVLGGDGNVIHEEYIRHNGRPAEQTASALARLLEQFPASSISRFAVTGSGGKVIAARTGMLFVNEVAAAARAASALYPKARTVIDIGGEDSKLVFVSPDGSIRDFAMNTSCAAGTGSFLDEQAGRLGYTIEQFADLGLKSEMPPRVAGRCSVFAKTDMIHLQQIATPDYDIIAGLAYAMARNFKSNLGKGDDFPRPVLFQGGVAANRCVVRAFKDALGLPDEDFIIPEHFASMGAIGAVLTAADNGGGADFTGVDGLLDYINRPRKRAKTLEPLAFLPDGESRHYIGQSEGIAKDASEKIPAYLGIDVGSVSTNVAALDEDGNCLAKSYLPTAGRPIEAVRQGLSEIWDKVGPRLEVKGVGTTGSGRYLTGDLVGADVVRNEITAQARGAVALDPTVDTIFEIGGQDSKFISLENGVVIDFAMNYVCAAGTGSFLEEQAERLRIKIKGEFQDLALSCTSPVRLGERCTVFMQSDLISHQQNGADVKELVSGLAYSIVHNYLNRVVGHRRVGRRIFFQGGTAANRAVVAAFEMITGKPITVPRHHDVTGAIGAALLAQEHQRALGTEESTFRGFELSERPYRIETFECKGCSNNCEIRKVLMEGESPLFYGSRCDKYNLKKAKDTGTRLPDLFKVREELINAEYASAPKRAKRGKIGIPRALFQQDLLPFWKALLVRLGFEVVVSPATDGGITSISVERAGAEFCFPAKIAVGHVDWLLARGVKRIFLPSITSLPKDLNDQLDNRLCPYVQTIPYVVKTVFDEESDGVEFVSPVFEFHRGKGPLLRQMLAFGRTFGATRRQVVKALDAALSAQKRFRATLERRAARVLRRVPKEVRKIVLIGRPYNTCDRGLNLDLPKKLLDLGVLPVPMGALLSDGLRLSDDWDNMYWKYGQRILAVAEKIAEDPEFDAIYITNFGCGPDSFLTGFFQRTLGKKPALLLEIDEHSADAGVITRLEAFLDSLANIERRAERRKRLFPPTPLKGIRRIYIPHMCEHSHALAASFRQVGIPAEALPPSDAESILLGRRHTIGKECLPAIITTGDMLRKINEPGFEPEKSAFFMPSGNGPCRFGQYHKLHRLILKDIGHEGIPIFAPNQGRNFYQDFKRLSKGVSGDPSRAGWQGIVAVDLLNRALHQTRPYEVHKGGTDRVFQRCLDRLCSTIEAGGDVPEVLRWCAAAFTSIPVDRPRSKPRVAVVGEIFVRHNEAANDNLVRRLEALGLEVDLATVSEWIFYTNHIRKRSGFAEKNFSDLFATSAKDAVQRFDESRLGKPFRKLLHHTVEPPSKLLLEMAAPYIHDSFEGEAILTVAKAVEFFGEGGAGIVNVMPFTCMPGTISATILQKFREDHDLMPVISIAYDGQEDATLETRLEAFAHQARQYHERLAAKAGRTAREVVPVSR
ncbi:MAG: acyl-CoA dehydratase activase [Planctomycetota bacterium]|jgi:predicted CoA-substrate-specific enzyme activase